MTYEAFKAEMQRLLTVACSYKPNEIGSSHYAEKMARLADAYPEFETRLDAECDAVPANS